MAKRFINSPANVVPDLMQGLSLDSSRVTLLDPATGHNVAIRASLAANTQTPRVSVVSGGGSGHEPMAAGYVGDGMLAAAVAGNVFVSPSVSDISAMLQAIAPRSTGILMVVMNYQGDLHNFDMAKNDLLQKSPGYPIHMMLVADDVARPNATDKRGIAGTIFVLKIAGAAADQGRPFQEVVNIAEMAARSTVTYGVALEPCTIPGHSVDKERLTEDEIELGMGIHGEHGAEKQLLSKLDGANLTRDLVSIICRRLDHAMHMKNDLAPRCTSLAIMVNNLGAVSQSEMLIICKAVSDFVYHADAGILNGNIHRVHLFVGSFMTSLQMNGVSVSCIMLPSDNGIMEQFLHAPSICTAWSAGFALAPPAKRNIVPRVADTRPMGHRQSSAANIYSPVGQVQSAANAPKGAYKTVAAVNPIPYRQPRTAQQYGGGVPSRTAPNAVGTTGVYAGPTARSGAAGTVTGLSPSIEMIILKITSALQSDSDELTDLDRKTGDGDFGDTVRRGCDSIRSDLEQGGYAHAAKNPSELLKAIAGSTEKMGGSSGVMTRVFLLAAADELGRSRSKGRDAGQAWRAAFVAGTRGVMEQGNAKVGDRTMVDALKPAADVFEFGSGSVAEAAHAARVGYESTKSMTRAKFGRSVHVRADKLLNQPDPGALAICIILDALADNSMAA